MKRTAIILISVVALSMMLMAVAPVMAKPGYVTVVVKDANGNPVPNVHVRIGQYTTPTTATFSQSYQTNIRGKVTIAIPAGFTNTYYSNVVEVTSNYPYFVECGTFEFNKKLSARVAVTYPPSV